MTDMIIVYGDESFNFNELPDTSRKTLAQGGLSHFLGNRVASKLTAWKAKNPITEGMDEEDYAELVEAKEEEIFTAAVNALRTGTAGSVARGGAGPRKTKVEIVTREVAKEFVIRAAKQKGREGELPSGKGSQTAWTTLIVNAINHPVAGPMITDEVARRMNTGAGVDIGDLF